MREIIGTAAASFLFQAKTRAIAGNIFIHWRSRCVRIVTYWIREVTVFWLAATSF